MAGDVAESKDQNEMYVPFSGLDLWYQIKSKYVN